MSDLFYWMEPDFLMGMTIGALWFAIGYSFGRDHNK